MECICVCGMHVCMWNACVYVECMCVCDMHMRMWNAYAYVICICVCGMHCKAVAHQPVHLCFI